MRHPRFLCFYVLAFFVTFSALAQQSNYPVVQENGQQYYLYTVEPKEGLYAVSHKFNVTQADILSCNPSIADGLKTGQQIKIPITVASSTKVSTGLRQHTVVKKQTLYSIAYLYGVTVESIVAINPNAVNGINDGDVLQIPAASKKEITETKVQSEPLPVVKPVVVPKKVADNKAVIHHEVVAGETFYSLSRKYNVKVADIKNANPTVEVLKVGATVTIPADSTKVTAKVTAQAKPTEIVPVSTKSDSNKKVIKVAMLLPFSLDGVKKDPTIDKFVDFYRGALVALAKLKDEGISVDVHTYDVAKTAAAVNKILETETSLANVDLIIGPAYSGQIKPVADFAKAHKIYVVIPFTQKVEGIETNPYLFQFNPALRTQFSQASALFSKQFKNNTIIIAQLAESSPSDEGVLFAEALTAKLKQQKIQYQTTTLQGGNLHAIKPWLNENKPAVVVLANANGEKVAPYLSAFAGLNTESKHVALYGFTGWEPESNVYPNLYFSSLFYTRNGDNLSDFDSQYIKWFHIAPNTGDAIRFDLLGFDLTLYFISVINQYGIPGFTQHLSAKLPDNIQSRFLFKRANGLGGYQNHELHLLNFRSGKGISSVSEW